MCTHTHTHKHTHRGLAFPAAYLHPLSRALPASLSTHPKTSRCCLFPEGLLAPEPMRARISPALHLPRLLSESSLWPRRALGRCWPSGAARGSHQGYQEALLPFLSWVLMSLWKETEPVLAQDYPVKSCPGPACLSAPQGAALAVYGIQGCPGMLPPPHLLFTCALG